MKKYEAMEAYKVSFNAKEQVAAACEIWDNGSKFAKADGTTACDVAGGKYIMKAYVALGKCLINEAGELQAGGMNASAKYQA